MKIKLISNVLAAAACLGMLTQPVFAVPPVVSAAVADVALAEGGVFTGKVVNAQGAPLAKTAVSLQQVGVEVASTETNEEGIFAVKGLRGGLYHVVADHGVVSYRLWAARTAPPAANQTALIVTGQEILNGQQCSGASLRHRKLAARAWSGGRRSIHFSVVAHPPAKAAVSRNAAKRAGRILAWRFTVRAASFASCGVRPPAID